MMGHGENAGRRLRSHGLYAAIAAHSERGYFFASFRVIRGHVNPKGKKKRIQSSSQMRTEEKCSPGYRPRGL